LYGISAGELFSRDRLSAGGPFREVFGRVLEAVGAFVRRLAGDRPAGTSASRLPM